MSAWKAFDAYAGGSAESRRRYVWEIERGFNLPHICICAKVHIQMLGGRRMERWGGSGRDFRKGDMDRRMFLDALYV